MNHIKFLKKGIENYLNEQKARLLSKRQISQRLTFKGFYEEKEDIPESGGVYAAFAKNSRGQHRLLYIGRAIKTNTLCKRIGEHIAYDHNTEKWMAHYDSETETICYSYVEISDDDITSDVEKVLIHENQPPVNDKHTEECNIDAQFVELTCTGNIGNMKPHVAKFKDVK